MRSGGLSGRWGRDHVTHGSDFIGVRFPPSGPRSNATDGYDAVRRDVVGAHSRYRQDAVGNFVRGTVDSVVDGDGARVFIGEQGQGACVWGRKLSSE